MTMMPITAALVVSHKTLLEEAHACLRNLPVRLALEQTELADADPLLDRLERHRVDVVLVEAGRLTMPLDEFVARLKNTATQPVVFVLHTEASPNLILEALRAGASEYLYSPLEDTLKDALERLSSARAKGEAARVGGLGKVFGFISGQGGCGATTIACHAASYVSKTLNQPVLLADMDFDAGLVRFVMKAKTAYSVRDAITNLHRMDASYWKALVSSQSNKLDVIPAPDDVAMKTPATGEEVLHLIRFIRSSYPAAIIDFGRCVNGVAIEALQELESLYLVTTPDPNAIAHARRAIQTFERSSRFASKVEVLLNKTSDRASTDRKSVPELLGYPVVETFVKDFSSLHDAYSEGQLLDGSTSLAKQFQKFSAGLTRRIRGEEQKQASSVQAAAPAAKRWFSFLQRGGQTATGKVQFVGNN